MVAVRKDITIDQGSTFEQTVVTANVSGANIDLSTYTVRAQLRKHYTSSNSVSFTTAGHANGDIILSLTASQSSNVVAGRYVYDVEIVDEDDVVTRVIGGIVTLTPEVTRS